MSPITTQVQQRVRGEFVPVTVVEPPAGAASEGRGDVLFLHGYARHPLDYRLVLEEAAERGWRVVAPFIFANNGLRTPPRHFWSCAGLAARTVEALHRDGVLSPGSPVFGHSTGAAVAYTLARVHPAPSAVLAINPVQPSSSPPLAFMARSAWMNTKMFTGLAGNGPTARAVLSEGAGRFYKNWLSRPRPAFDLIGGLRAFRYERLARWVAGGAGAGPPVRVLYGCGDEFYPESFGIESGLRQAFDRVEVEVLEGENSHEWLLFRPEKTVDALEAFFVPSA
ncbi:MAG: alpha/beta hydrolase [Planctomycetota bacterium]|nr:alpha/beta hydrolase [Planctomycetota bacterium]MDG1984476.1 alpha/beta hydrolase [Planctomycetota bacterium]